MHAAGHELVPSHVRVTLSLFQELYNHVIWYPQQSPCEDRQMLLSAAFQKLREVTVLPTVSASVRVKDGSPKRVGIASVLMLGMRPLSKELQYHLDNDDM